MQPQTETNLVKYCQQHHAVRSCSNHSVRFKNSNFTENIHHYCGTLSALKRLEMLKTRSQKTRCNDLNCSHTERPVEATCHNELCCYLHSFALWRTGTLGPHEKTEILGCKSVKLLYFIPMLPTVVQSMMFHLHADLPYCGLKRLNSESRCWFAQYPAPFPICVARVRSSFIHNNLPVMRTNECSYPSLVRFCTREELRQTSFLRKLGHCSSNKLRNSLQCITRHPRNVPRDHDSKVQITHLKK